MPQVFAAVLIGAGLAAGVKWIAREMSRAADLAREAHEQMTRAPEFQTVPKDLGALEWDAETGVYRPARGRA
jgi:ribose 1,5-bisphosphokinase PhnN